jgi:hypothetical protein
MKSLAILLILIFFSAIDAYSQARTSFHVDDAAIMKYAGERTHQMQYRVGRQTGEKLGAYADKNAIRVYSTNELSQIGAHCESVQIPNPANPDDPYDMIDTTICEPFDPGVDHSWILYPGSTFKSNTWKEIKSVGVFYDNSPSGSPLLYFYRRSDLDSRLMPEEKRLLQAYLDYTNPAGHKMDSVIISDTLLKTFITNWYDSVSSFIYHKVEKGSMVIWQNDSLTQRLPLDNLERFECYTVQTPNPFNPDDPYDMIDTTVCKAFLPSELKGFAASYDWVVKDIGPVPQLKGIGLLHQPRIAEIELPNTSMFWLKAEDTKKAVPQQDWLLMTDIFNFHLLSSIERDYYWR